MYTHVLGYLLSAFVFVVFSNSRREMLLYLLSASLPLRKFDCLAFHNGIQAVATGRVYAVHNTIDPDIDSYVETERSFIIQGFFNFLSVS